MHCIRRVDLTWSLIFLLQHVFPRLHLWCTVNRTFHRANPTTLKHFVRQFFFFLIVSNGGWNDESYKKIEYLFIFVPYLSVLKVREWIYVDVEWIYVDVDRPRFQEKNYTIVSTDHQVQLLNGFAIFHKAQHTHGLWKIAKKPNHIVKFGCGNDCVKLYFFQKMRFFFQKIVKNTKKMRKIFFLSKTYTLLPKLSYMF